MSKSERNDCQNENAALTTSHENGSEKQMKQSDRLVPDSYIFKILSNQRRRRVIQYLRNNDRTTTVGELAEEIAAEENETTVQQLSSYERKCVYVGLYQNHLPMMDDGNVIDYDDDRKTVELRETVTQVEPYLDETAESVDHRMLGALTGVIATGVFLGTLQIGLFSSIPVSAWILLGLIALLGVAVLDWYSDSTVDFLPTSRS